MKLSKYTFPFRTEYDEYYVYNTLSNALVEIDGESYELLERSEGELPESDFDPELWNALSENNIITDSDDDDYLKYKSCIQRMRVQRGSMHLTLAPTMDCCFRCHYCFEKYKEPNYMKPQVMDAIVKYVTSIPDLKLLKITWFGGEPLMALPQMEEFHDRLSEATSIPVQSNIITTGYHIDEEAFRVIKKLGINSVQITLDGLKETHNRIKHLDNGDDVFERVMNNIGLLNDMGPEINIVIRVNLTLENAWEYEPLYDLFVQRFKGRKNLGITPAFVLDRGASNCDSCQLEKTLFHHKERSEYILDLSKKGIDSVYVRYPEPFFYECAIRNDMAISFDPEGYAYKCWELIGNKEYAIGRLNAEGALTHINGKILNRQSFGADPLEDPVCMQCKYLPICNGGCPIQRIENKFENKRNCTCAHYKGYMVDFLKIHLARKKVTAEYNSKI